MLQEQLSRKILIFLFLKKVQLIINRWTFVFNVELYLEYYF